MLNALVGESLIGDDHRYKSVRRRLEGFRGLFDETRHLIEEYDSDNSAASRKSSDGGSSGRQLSGSDTEKLQHSKTLLSDEVVIAREDEDCFPRFNTRRVSKDGVHSINAN